MTGANEEGGFTTLQFERKLETCDPDDIAINFVSYRYQFCINGYANKTKMFRIDVLHSYIWRYHYVASYLLVLKIIRASFVLIISTKSYKLIDKRSIT